MYTIIITWSNLKYALLMLSRYCFNSNLTHIKIVTRVLRYVKSTLYYDIYYKSKESLIAYTNVDFAKVIND